MVFIVADLRPLNCANKIKILAAAGIPSAPVAAKKWHRL